MTATSKWEEELWMQLVFQANVPRPVREYVFHPTRNWRFDFSWPGYLVNLSHYTRINDTTPPGVGVLDGLTFRSLIAVEMEGGIHRIKDRFARDVEKYNEAQLLGWTVLRVTPGEIKAGLAIPLICRALGVSEKARDRVTAAELRYP